MGGMRCRACGTENPERAKFCMQCGAELGQACPDCGTELPAGAQFYSECGAPGALLLRGGINTQAYRGLSRVGSGVLTEQSNADPHAHICADAGGIGRSTVVTAWSFCAQRRDS
jgi:hypothetical protein